jgi:hypothetical protein
MQLTLTLAAVALISGLSQNPPLAEATAAPAAAPAPAAQPDVQPPGWTISVRALAPATTTDPQHLALAVGLAHTGAYRAAVRYQPTETGRVGFIQASIGVRVLARETWQVALDLEHAQARPVRRGFRGSGWDLDFHERHQVSIATASIQWRDARFFGLVGGLEVGAGQMHVWRLVSARAGADTLSLSPDPILESSAPVGMLGLRMGRSLFWGLDGQARVRVIGAGRSRGGEVPFAHMTAEWDVTRQLFQSKKFGRMALGLTGTHATSPRAVTYFQNGIGLVFRAAF